MKNTNAVFHDLLFLLSERPSPGTSESLSATSSNDVSVSYFNFSGGVKWLVNSGIRLKPIKK